MIKTSHRATILFALIAFSFAANATLIEFVPSNQTEELGNQVLVDIVVTPDSGVLIGAFDFIVNYDASILSVVDVGFGAALNDDAFFCDLLLCRGSPDSGGMLNLFETSLVFDLTTLQDGSPFLLATIFFDTLDLGTSVLSLTGNILDQVSPFNYLGDEFGLPLSAEPGTGSITIIEAPVVVPEPPTWALLIVGLLVVSVGSQKISWKS